MNPSDFCDGAAEAIRGSPITEAIAERSLGDYDLRPRAQPLRRIPTLVVAGGDDPYRSSAEAWAAVLPTAHLVVLEGAGHIPMLERPEELHRAVREFVDRSAPGRRR